MIGLDQGVVLLQKGVTSDPQLLNNWRAYLSEIKPIMES